MAKMNNERDSITADRLKELVSYDAETGVFRRLTRTTRHSPGDVAGNAKGSAGYIRFRVDGLECHAHRLAWLYAYGVWPSKHIDHIDGNPSNNALSNLREASDGENAQNQWRASKRNRVGLLGVSWHKCGFWRARIAVGRKSKTIGYFHTPEMAHAAYMNAKRDMHPFGTIAQVSHG